MKKHFLFLLVIIGFVSCGENNDIKYPRNVTVELKAYTLSNEEVFAKEIFYISDKPTYLQKQKLPFSISYRKTVKDWYYKESFSFLGYDATKSDVILEIIIDGKSVKKKTISSEISGSRTLIEYNYPAPTN